MDREKSFLRWSGLAGMTAGIFFILTIVTLIEFGPSTTATPAQLVMNFPQCQNGPRGRKQLLFLGERLAGWSRTWPLPGSPRN